MRYALLALLLASRMASAQTFAPQVPFVFDPSSGGGGSTDGGPYSSAHVLIPISALPGDSCAGFAEGETGFIIDTSKSATLSYDATEVICHSGFWEVVAASTVNVAMGSASLPAYCTQDELKWVYEGGTTLDVWHCRRTDPGDGGPFFPEWEGPVFSLVDAPPSTDAGILVSNGSGWDTYSLSTDVVFDGGFAFVEHATFATLATAVVVAAPANISTSGPITLPMNNVDASGGAVDVTLPDCATYTGPAITVKKIERTANPVTILGAGTDLVGLFSFFAMATAQESVTLVCNNYPASGNHNWAITVANPNDFTPRRTELHGVVVIDTDPYQWFGVKPPTETGASPAEANASDTAHLIVPFTTGGSNHNIAGIGGTTVQAQKPWAGHPRLDISVRTSASLADQRIWIALQTGAGALSLAGNGTIGGSDGTGVFANPYVGIRYSTDAMDTTWQLCSGDGTTGSCSDTTMTVSANKTYQLTLDYSGSGQVVFYGILGATSIGARKTTNLPTTDGTLWNYTLGIETLTNATTLVNLGDVLVTTQFGP